jgi:hypothetical protein
VKAASIRSELSHDDRLIAAKDILERAFSESGVRIDPRRAYNLAHWYLGPNFDAVRFQDPRSRKLVEAVRDAAAKLGYAIAEAYEHSGYADAIAGVGPFPNDEGEKINLCETLFYEDEECECVWSVAAIEIAADLCLDRGKVPARAGRPPLLAYYMFVRVLHEVFQSSTGTKGFYEKAGSADGPFIDVVVAAQTILPDYMRLRERKTIANRVLQAFTVEIPD